jgi:BMFP domain-containing protein YqiC
MLSCRVALPYGPGLGVGAAFPRLYHGLAHCTRRARPALGNFHLTSIDLGWGRCPPISAVLTQMDLLGREEKCLETRRPRTSAGVHMRPIRSDISFLPYLKRTLKMLHEGMDVVSREQFAVVVRRCNEQTHLRMYGRVELSVRSASSARNAETSRSNSCLACTTVYSTEPPTVRRHNLSYH